MPLMLSASTTSMATASSPSTRPMGVQVNGLCDPGIFARHQSWHRSHCSPALLTILKRRMVVFCIEIFTTLGPVSDGNRC